VVELEYLAEAYERNLRYYFRVQPVLEQPIDLTVLRENQQFNVIDISGGGLCFSGKGLSMLKDVKIGQKLKLLLDIYGQREMQLETVVVRKYYGAYFEYVGVKFLNIARKDRQVLLSAINRIQRIALRRRSGLYYT
jgi:c-di-GMP-binding flagellar brake protein YcgR